MKSTTISLVALLFAAGCSNIEQDNAALRQALDASDVTLRASVSVAEGSLDDARAIRATFLTRSKVLSVGALAAGALNDVRIEPTNGSVVSTRVLGGGAAACEGSGSLEQAIAVAEDAVDGEAVTIVPDDDDPCDREVKVLDGDDVLWEVKVAPDGTVKETEVADDADETDG